jgi:copper resistance protein B
LNFYGKDDPERGVESGFSDAQIALRLRYEIRREIAPYIGVAWVRRPQDSEVQALAGLRFWF